MAGAQKKKVTRKAAPKTAAKKAPAKRAAEGKLPATAQKPLEERVLTAEGWHRRMTAEFGVRKVAMVVTPPPMKSPKGKRKG